MKKPGRRTKRTPETAKKICEAVARGVPFVFASRLAGISPATFHSWREQSKAFREQVEAAIADGIRSRLATIEKAAGLGDWRAAAWLLEHTQPEHFAKNRGEARIGTAVQIQISLPQKESTPVIPMQATAQLTNEN